jgi:ParB family transcriptional regulator, chromosome partitioning protein
MGQNSQKASGADAGGNLLYFAPEKLTLVTDPKHPLFDERVHLPVDEALVRNIMVYGITQPVTLRLNGRIPDGTHDGKPIVEVVVGRQRVKAALEANKRLAKEGAELIRVPAVMKRAEAGTLAGVMIGENEHRKADTPIVRARKLERFLALGKSEEEAAIAFGVTEATIKNMLKVLELHPKVQKAIEAGTVPVNVAKELSVIPQEEQGAALDKLIAAGNLKGARGVEAAKNVRKMSRAQLETWKKVLKDTEGKDADIAYAVVSRILGGERGLSNYPRLRDALEKAEA